MSFDRNGSGYEIKQYHYDKDTKRSFWDTAIGLQKVDHLTPSQYLIDLAQDDIDGKITNDAIEELLNTRYEVISQEKEARRNPERECDFVSNRIVKYLKEQEGISLSIGGFKAVHSFLFRGIYDHAGKFRTANISKAEDILNGESVRYANFFDVKDTLEYDFSTEKETMKMRRTENEVIKGISKFTSDIWQVHPFWEGNTRTTAVFIQSYLNSMGFDVNNDLFKEHSLYFRNALVRANYDNYRQGIYSTQEYLEKFYGNLLFDRKEPMHNRDLMLKENFIKPSLLLKLNEKQQGLNDKKKDSIHEQERAEHKKDAR